MINESLIAYFIRKTLEKNGRIKSLSYLQNKIKEEFLEGISIPRLRKIIIKYRIGRLRIKTKKSERKILRVCPVCKHKLKLNTIQTLQGNIVVESFSCRNCGYKGFPDAWKVARYEILKE